MFDSLRYFSSKQKSKIIFWTRNQWRDWLGYYFTFDLFSYNQTKIFAHGIEYMEYRLKLVNFEFVWRIHQ